MGSEKCIRERDCELAVDLDVGCIADFDGDVCFAATGAPTVSPTMEVVVTSPPSTSPVAQPTDDDGSSASHSIASWSKLSFAVFLPFVLVNAWMM